MNSCTDCGQPLVRKQSEFGLFWACEGCGRWLVGLPILRRTLEPEFFARFWQLVRTVDLGAGKLCPTCSKEMVRVSVGTPEAPIDPFVCRSCNLALLSPEERAHLPIRSEPEKAKPEPPAPEDQLPPEAAQLLAIHQAEVIAENARRENQFKASHLPLWQKILAAVGFPVEDDPNAVYTFPWATVSIAAVTIGASLYFFSDLRSAAEEYGFTPTEFDRNGGSTFLTCFFVHAGWMHLLGNMYFLLVFGRGVENRIGPLGILLLLALSTVGGDLFSLVFNPTSDIPHIGASGGIAGVLLFYGFAFPQKRLVFSISGAGFTGIQLVRFPAWAVLLLWVGVQVLGSFSEKAGTSAVAYSGHLGGLTAGLAFWLLWRWKNSGGWIKVQE